MTHVPYAIMVATSANGWAQVAEPVRIPFIKGTKLMSEREVTEVARHGEVLRWSSDSDKEEMTDRGADRTIGSDTTASTPDCFKSPNMGPVRITGEIVKVASFEIQARQDKRKCRQ